MEEKILDLIKKYDKVIIARHIGGDPDALGATFALKEILSFKKGTCCWSFNIKV